MQGGTAKLMGLPTFYKASEPLSNELVTIANPQHWFANFKQSRFRFGALFIKYTGRTTRENQTTVSFKLNYGYANWDYLCIDAKFTYLAGNQVSVLSAGIKYCNCFHGVQSGHSQEVYQDSEKK